jgi:hypothetical protein
MDGWRARRRRENDEHRDQRLERNGRHTLMIMMGFLVGQIDFDVFYCVMNEMLSHST